MEVKMTRAFSIFEQRKRIAHVTFSYFTLNVKSTEHDLSLVFYDKKRVTIGPRKTFEKSLLNRTAARIFPYEFSKILPTVIFQTISRKA